MLFPIYLFSKTRGMVEMINTATLQRTALLIGRGLLGVYFIVPGIAKITGWSGTVDEMAAQRDILAELHAKLARPTCDAAW